MQSFAVFF